MRSHVNRPWTTAAVVILLEGVLFGGQQDYQIKLHRDAVIGQKYRFAASASQQQTMVATMDGQAGPAEDTSTTAELTGYVTTLGATASGKESKVSLMIETSKCSADGVTSQVLPPGTTVIAERIDEMRTYTVNDSPVNPRAAKCLKLALPLNAGTKTTDDDIFGTRLRQKVGSAWAMNNALAATDLFGGSGLKVATQDVTGSTRLIEVTSFNDAPALRIGGEMTMKNVLVPLPPGIAIKTSEFRASMSALLPVDASRSEGQMGMKMTGRIDCSGESSGHTLRLMMTMSQEMEHTLKIEK